MGSMDNSGHRRGAYGLGSAPKVVEGDEVTRFLIRLDILAASFMWVAKWLIAGMILSWIWFLFDRAPPITVVSVEPASAKPGEFVTITAHVQRDMRRECSAKMSRYIFDASGARFDMGDSGISADMITSLERKAPGLLKVSFQIPLAASEGRAELMSVLDYQCNRTHILWPIVVTTRLPFTVL